MNISVCIATYNGAQFIAKQLQSILIQIGLEDEVIIVDDCSTDNTISIVKMLFDQRIKILKNEKNEGFVRTFERAVMKAKNDIIFLSDQDDIWYPCKVQKVMDLFCATNVDMIIHNGKVVNENLYVLSENLFSNELGKNFFTRNFLNNHNMGCMMAFRKNLSAHLFPIPCLVESHDQWFGLNADLEGKKIVFLNQNLIYWVRHGRNASFGKRRSFYKCIISRIKMIILTFIVLWRKKIMGIKI